VVNSGPPARLCGLAWRVVRNSDIRAPGPCVLVPNLLPFPEETGDPAIWCSGYLQKRAEARRRGQQKWNVLPIRCRALCKSMSAQIQFRCGLVLTRDSVCSQAGLLNPRPGSEYSVVLRNRAHNWDGH
jgi:hypothetical protein